MATITKRGNSYRIKVSCGYDINGKQIIKSLTWQPDKKYTEKQLDKEVQRQAVLFEEKCRQGLVLDSRIKFADFANLFMENYARKQLKIKTVVRYEAMLERLNQAFGHIEIGKIQPIHIMQFQENLSEEGIRKDIKYHTKKNVDINALIQKQGCSKYMFCKINNIPNSTIIAVCNKKNISEQSAKKLAVALGQSKNNLFEVAEGKKTLSDKTIRNYHNLISSIMDKAVKWQVITSNPCSRVEAPKVAQKESPFLESDDAYKVIENLDKEDIILRAIVELLINTGMRRGELCGLKWSDIDFDNHLISIRREIVYIAKEGLKEDTPKSKGSNRIIKVPEIIFPILKKVRTAQNIQKMKCGDLWIDKDFIFVQWNGEPIHPDTVSKKVKDYLKSCNLENVSTHSLRHTNATLLISNGVNITTVAKRLGHADSTTTAKIYAHAIKKADEEAASTLQNIFKGAN